MRLVHSRSAVFFLNASFSPGCLTFLLLYTGTDASGAASKQQHKCWTEQVASTRGTPRIHDTRWWELERRLHRKYWCVLNTLWSYLLSCDQRNQSLLDTKMLQSSFASCNVPLLMLLCFISVEFVMINFVPLQLFKFSLPFPTFSLPCNPGDIPIFSEQNTGGWYMGPHRGTAWLTGAHMTSRNYSIVRLVSTCKQDATAFSLLGREY